MNQRQREQALARQDARAEYYQRRLEAGHRNQAVLTRWRREVLKAKALAACLRDGRRRGPWDAYLEEVRG
ncbi:MAG: hypothetical protein HPY83_08855 [Anaerolineae bacterium]|nr:hypothetical protein [Anaerolineae bacterium]